MKILDRMGKEITIGSKLAWVSSSCGTSLLKIGEVLSFEQKQTYEGPETRWDREKILSLPTGKIRVYGDIIIRAEIRNPNNLSKTYIAKLPSTYSGYKGEPIEDIKINRAELV